MQSRPPVLVVEDDPVLRQVEVVLDPRTSAERSAAYASYVAHDVPGWHAWRDTLRAKLAGHAIEGTGEARDFIIRLPLFYLGCQIAAAHALRRQNQPRKMLMCLAIVPFGMPCLALESCYPYLRLNLIVSLGAVVLMQTQHRAKLAC